jgi:anti-sigma-K factor RskA
MKRTTVFADDEVIGALQAIARRRGVTLSEITREALAAYVTRQQRRRKPLTLTGIGRSGRRDVAERAEEILKEGFGR